MRWRSCCKLSLWRTYQTARGRGLTPPSSGHPPAGCACLRLPLMSNVRPHEQCSGSSKPDILATVRQKSRKASGPSSAFVSLSVALALAVSSAFVACSNPSPPEVVAELAVSADGTYALQGKAVSPPTLTQALKDLRAAHPDVQLRIAADGRASHQSVVSAMQAASAAGISRLALASTSK